MSSPTPPPPHAHAPLGRPAAPDARLEALMRARGAEEGARLYLEELRWPDGVRCPRCASDRIGWIEERTKHYCRDCRYHFRVTAGTVFHDSHVSLARWLTAVQLIVESDRGLPANRLQAAIGGGYKTAWFVGHRIRAAMSQSLLDLGLPLALAQAVEQADRASAPPPPGAPAGPAAERWMLLKKLVAGDYHRPSPEHLTAYWNEARWRAANIGNADVFRETAHALLATEPLPYDRLIDRTRPVRAGALGER